MPFRGEVAYFHIDPLVASTVAAVPAFLRRQSAGKDIKRLII